jgi:ADP-heptose:LPS heptosyltransferase
VICTFPEDRFAIWAFFSKAHRRVGQKRQPFSRLLTDTPDISKRDKGVLEYYCDLARALGATVNSSATEYHVPAESRQWADRFFAEQKLEAKVIAIHPGATGDYKIWPPERYAGLIHRIRAFGAVHLLLVYGTGDRNVVNEIRRHLRAKIPEVCTEEIGKLGALLQQSALLISNDSGPRHLAAALGTPTLTLFRHYHDREWKIYQDDRTHSTLQGNGICTACPAEICKDIIPEGERFGSICLRMVTVEDAYRRGIDLLKG